VSRYYGWKPYVPVAARRANAVREMQKLRKQGLDIKPVEVKKKKIAHTFWGEAWCDHLESLSDFENRLPRGRTYVRNKSVCHLDITKGKVNAMVIGSELYTVKIAIKPLPRKTWKDVKSRCAGQVASILDLLQGRLSKGVMSIVTDHDDGLFPLSDDITMQCSCPDCAIMCKHVAAVLYGVGTRLDEQPELLFLLRGVNHKQLISGKVDVTSATAGRTKGKRRRIAVDAIGDVFGIEMAENLKPAKANPGRRRRQSATKSGKASKAAAKRSSKAKAKPATSTTRARRTPASQEAKPKQPPRPTRRGRPVTGKSIARLRRKFAMTKSEFAKLLGVSAPTIGNWENTPDALNLQQRSRDAWNAAKALSKRQAHRKLNAA